MSGLSQPFWAFAGSDQIALRGEDGDVWSYARLEAAIAAHPLAAAERGLHVLHIENDIDDVVTLLAALRHGHAAILAGDAGRAVDLATAFAAHTIWRGRDATYTGLAAPKLHPDLALMLSTSGSTGSGKCVRLSYDNLSSNAAAIADYLDLDREQRAITSLPLHYSYGLSVLTSHLHAGASVTVTGKSIIDPAFAEMAGRDAITSLAGVPHSYDLIERTGLRNRLPATLRTLTQAGGRLDPDTVERFRAWIASRGGRMFVMYGQTEATARIAFVPAEQLADRRGMIGRAIPGGRIELIDEAGNVTDEDGVAGELVYHGLNVMLGYATSSAELGLGHETEALATGDLAVREDGLFRIVGRKSRFIKMFGLRVDLDQVERQLHSAGIEAAVTGTDDRLVIATVGECGGTAAIIDALQLPAGSVRHLKIDAVPRLANGKPDYPALLRTGGSPDDRPPAEHVRQLFARTFPRQAILDQACFADLGGDSLSYVQFSLELEALIGNLPDDWDLIPVSVLEAAEQAHRDDPRTFDGVGRTVPVDAAIRTLGIASVVANHASAAPVGGGVAALILLVGYSLARFRRRQLERGEWRPLAARWALTIWLPYIVLIVGYAVLVKPVPISLFTLTGNHDESLRGFVEPFWFISAYSQLLLLVAGSAALLPPVREIIARRPFAAGLWVLCASTAMLAIAAGLGSAASGRGLIEVMPLAALGWCAALANDRRRRMIVALATCLVAVVEGGLRTSQGWAIMPVLLHIGWWILPPLCLVAARSVSLPGWLRRAIMLISAASFTIYLTHTLPIWLLARATHHNPGLWAAAIALVTGVAIHLATANLFARLRPTTTRSDA